MLWLYIGFLNLLSIALIIAAFAIFVSFDRWRQEWWWGLLRCIGIMVFLYLSQVIIWHGLSLIGE
jgi:hypothetical protein